MGLSEGTSVKCQGPTRWRKPGCPPPTTASLSVEGEKKEQDGNALFPPACLSNTHTHTHTHTHTLTPLHKCFIPTSKVRTHSTDEQGDSGVMFFQPGHHPLPCHTHDSTHPLPTQGGRARFWRPRLSSECTRIVRTMSYNVHAAREVPSWGSGMRIWCGLSCGAACKSVEGSVPGQGTSTCHGYGQNKNESKNSHG